MSELGERLIAALAEHGNTLPALQHLMAQAWEEGRLDGHAEEQSGFENAMNPYRN